MEKIEVSNEELEAEQKALAETVEDDVRTAIIDEFGFDSVDDADKIDKLVEKEMSHKKDLSQAIGQKIKYRNQIQESQKPKPTEQPKEPVVTKVEDFDKKIDEVVTARLEKNALDSMDYSDELKEEISTISKVKGISVKQAVKDPYIAFKIGEYEKEQQVNEATISRTNKSGSKTKFSVDTPPEVNMATEEGRKKWDEYLDWQKQQPGYRDSDINI